jgi:hypothetical protein
VIHQNNRNITVLDAGLRSTVHRLFNQSTKQIEIAIFNYKLNMNEILRFSETRKTRKKTRSVVNPYADSVIDIAGKSIIIKTNKSFE